MQLKLHWNKGRNVGPKKIASMLQIDPENDWAKKRIIEQLINSLENLLVDS